MNQEILTYEQIVEYIKQYIGKFAIKIAESFVFGGTYDEVEAEIINKYCN